MTRQVVENNIAVSLRHMNVETLEILQFQCWDYDYDGYLDALKH